MSIKYLLRLMVLIVTIGSLGYPDQANAHSGKQTFEMVSSYDGIKLRLSKDYPKVQPKAILIIAHGLSNHLGLYDNFTKDLNKDQIAIYR